MRRNKAVALRGTHSLHRSVAVLMAFAAATAACAAPIRHTSVPQPAPCNDSIYVRLKSQHPDSLSERAWQRLQDLDRDCTTARTAAQMEMSGMMGMGHGRSWRRTGAGLVAVLLMVIMMTALR